MRGILQVRWVMFIVTSLIVFLSADPLAAFEGVVHQRSLHIGGNTLYEAYIEAHEDAPDSADALIQWVIGLPSDRLVELARSDADGSVSKEAIYVKGGKFRADLDTEDSPMDFVLADMDRGVLYMVNSAQKMYVEFSPEGMKTAVEEAMKQAAQAMREAGMDEAAIEQMLAEMKGNTPPGAESDNAAPSLAVKPLGRTMRIGTFDTQGYLVETDEERVVGWVAEDPYGIGAVMKDFVEKMSKAFEMAEDDEEDAEELLWKKGLPVRVQKFSLDARDGVSEFDETDIVEVEPKDLSDDLFQVPAGFTKKTPQELFGMQP